MPEEPTPPSPQPGADLQGLDAGELLARGLHTVKPSAGSGPWEPPTPEELAALLPQYRIESLLGRGGMGAVYKGVQATLDRPVAIKLLPAELATDADFLARFQREARTLAKLQHSGIVAVYDFGQTSAGHPYFVMEFVDGTDLQHVLKGPGLQPEQAFVLIGQICDALHYAHQQGVIHRDIKPANILLTRDGRSKVADFGLARPLTEESGGLTMTNMIMGTPDYMAPESRTGTVNVDHRADIFALGVMLYEMLTGQRPHGAFQPPSQRVQVDVRIDEVVLKALQQEPDRRYQQASEMKVDVDRIRTTPPEKAQPARGGRRSVAAVAIAAALLVLGGLAFFFPQPTNTNEAASDGALTEQRPPSGSLAWQPAPMSATEKTMADANGGWVAPHRWYAGGITDGAVRMRYRWIKGAQFSVTLRESREKKGAKVGLTSDGRVQLHDWDKDPTPRTAMQLPPLATGDEGTIEFAVVGTKAIARVNGRILKLDVSSTERGTFVMGNGYMETPAAVRDVEIVNLDGLPDPLAALGWEVDHAVAATSSGWRDFLAELEATPKSSPNLNNVWPKEGQARRVTQYHLHTLPDTEGRDLSIRLTGTLGPDGKKVPAANIAVHARMTGDLGYTGRLFSNGAAKIQKGAEVLKGFPPAAGFDAEKSHTLELRTEKDLVTLLLDGVALGSVRDGSLPPGGSFGAAGQVGGLIQKIEYQFLEEPVPSPGPAKSADAKAIGEAKKLLVEARAHLKAGDVVEALKLTNDARVLTRESLRAPDDLGILAEATLIFAEAQRPQDTNAMAMDFLKRADAEHPQFAAITELRVKLTPTLKQYEQHLRTAAELVGKGDDAGEIRELKAALALVPDGKQAAEKLAANPLHVGRALPGRRFTNELGHTYVPVEGLPNVLFSTWETRVKDFEQFVKETSHDMSQPRSVQEKDKALTWQKPGFEQTGDHPVVMVSREDAEFFCRWLTDQERKVGRLLPGQVYRLPTDREWSAAMGVLHEPGDFPSDRKFPKDVFTWPKDTQPKHNAENLNWKNDDFPFTAPVGSGQPNPFGIYDLLGNVQELCAGPWSFQEDASVSRGSSFQSRPFVYRDKTNFYGGFGELSQVYLGFRCVLDLKTDPQREVQIVFESAFQKFSKSAKPEDLKYYRKVRGLINDEMVLLNLGPKWASEKEVALFADLPVTHLYGSGGGLRGAIQFMRKWPLRVVSFYELLGQQEDFLESFRGTPLEWLHLFQHPDGTKAIKSFEALRGMKLKGLFVAGFTKLENIEPLRGMPLEELHFMGYAAGLDLTPVKDAPLRKVTVPSSISMDRLLLACDWWGTKVQSLHGDEVYAFSRFFREAALTGDPAKVVAVKQTLAAKFANVSALKGWLGRLDDKPVTQSLDLCVRAARLIGGDASAFAGQFQTFQGHAYLYWDQGLSLDEAKAFAVRMGGHMLTITSKEENDFIIQKTEAGVFRKDFSLGLERTGPGRLAWKWVTDEPLAYHNWGPESGASSDAAVFVQDKGRWLWFHQGKEQPRPFIIEWDTPTPQPPAAGR